MKVADNNDGDGGVDGGGVGGGDDGGVGGVTIINGTFPLNSG